jgi:hypothetical protein
MRDCRGKSQGNGFTRRRGEAEKSNCFSPLLRALRVNRSLWNDHHLRLLGLPVWSGPEDRGAATRRGKSELSRAAGWLTARRGDATESATENRPPIASASQGAEEEVRVKRCGKSAPRPTRVGAARQTPCGARPNREVMEPPVSVMSFRVGCLTGAVTRPADE